MKIFTSIKPLTLVVALLLAGSQTSEAKLVKPSGGSSSGNVVISKVFYAGSTRLNGATPKNYMKHLYIELYNNSTDTLDLKGLYIGFANTDSGAAGWTATAMAEAHKDSVVLKQIFQISPDAEYRFKPGQSVVIAQCAIDHSEIAEGNVDLSNADFECKSTNNAYNDHNDAVPELKVIKTYGTSDFLNFMNPGPNGIVLLAADTNLDKCPETFGKGKTSGNIYTIVPLFKTIDCVDIVKQKTPSADDKRIADGYDAGFTCTEAEGTFSGQAVVRKTAYVCSDGRIVLFDTNNSSVDFESTGDLSLRTYSTTPSGLDETLNITIPESGFLTINPEKPFCASKELVFVHVNASNNAATTDLGYYEFPGDSLLLIKGPWIAVGKPGEYTIRLSESQGVMKTRSSMVNWADEDEKSVSQTNRMFYKFTATNDKVGFQRVPAVDGKYNKATFTDADRLYIIVTTAIADKIAAANGATNNEDLDFITWHGITPDEVVATGIQTVKSRVEPTGLKIYNLQGVRLNSLQKGINIVNGKLIVTK
ncbi:MAG: DUF4876 domain-containing protein [Prevotella sp.]|nr:DUF4876 domain-containing protein [Prevotella sp.]